MISFGPELVGRTEKTLGALLHRNLVDTGLDEREYVTLRVASTLTSTEDLSDAVFARAHFTEAAELVATLTERGLLSHGRLSPTGSALLDRILSRAAGQSAAIWSGLPDADVATTTRVLNTVLARADAVLSE
ncbi:hypothetical protein SAMN05892883_1944 [Jatrophihabitans sp. GAS493]|uniref:hypothetical protein n=1 Tax=Jatrophihabitans sp. GAS493 TaxID=1907575 RepID=UPI000BB91120|nr:hypothetical protein [Jatrophihabitans sp. GAS493]SOD72560.1 hypothetical protein SAMN05892883_1944 [Jatrophihabitans sp. GAS493]